MKVCRGKPVLVENQEFIGYSAPVRSLQEVNLAYAKVRAMHTDARHVVCACRLPGRNLHTHQDFADDGEHNTGQFLLQLLEKSDITNRVVMVARFYDGTHLGLHRYEAMKDAMASAIDASSYNSTTDRYDMVWIDEHDDSPNGTGYMFNFGNKKNLGRQ